MCCLTCVTSSASTLARSSSGPTCSSKEGTCGIRSTWPSCRHPLPLRQRLCPVSPHQDGRRHHRTCYWVQTIRGDNCEACCMAQTWKATTAAELSLDGLGPGSASSAGLPAVVEVWVGGVGPVSRAARGDSSKAI